jgi:hypothetical protein
MSVAYEVCIAIGAMVVSTTTIAAAVVAIAALSLRYRKRRGYYALAVARYLVRCHARRLERR